MSPEPKQLSSSALIGALSGVLLLKLMGGEVRVKYEKEARVGVI